MTEPSALSDQALLDEVDASARRERTELPHFLACLAEVERRGLHVELGHHNLFEYCVARLRFSEGAAMQRVCAARAAAKHPEVYARLRDGDLNLSGVARLFPYLNFANAASVLSRASGKRQKEIEDLIAELAFVQAEAKAAEKEAREAPVAEVSEQNEFSFARPSLESPPEPASASPISEHPPAVPIGAVAPAAPMEVIAPAAPTEVIAPAAPMEVIAPAAPMEAIAPTAQDDHPPEIKASQTPEKIEECERAAIVPEP